MMKKKIDRKEKKWNVKYVGAEHTRRSEFCSVSCRNKNWRLNNKERRKEYYKKFQQDHKEYCKEYCKQYHLAHKNDEAYLERKRRNSREYYKRLKEKERLLEELLKGE
jgi:tRNA/tmRNA/rRNA uracil-C5-methylase (TrmA/RlmC/RlmD family)